GELDGRFVGEEPVSRVHHHVARVDAEPFGNVWGGGDLLAVRLPGGLLPRRLAVSRERRSAAHGLPHVPRVGSTGQPRARADVVAGSTPALYQPFAAEQGQRVLDDRGGVAPLLLELLLGGELVAGAKLAVQDPGAKIVCYALVVGYPLATHGWSLRLPVTS